jgi:8-oxo-dGTP pyrophosphatase MutT (NUDIX family)
MNSTPEYASVILLTDSNEIILQLRDNIPTIVDPNVLSLFAGRLLDGESAEEGARRELQEETTLELGTLSYFMTYETTLERHGRVSKSHVFVATNIDVNHMDVREGQGFRLIHSYDDLQKHHFALVSKDILEEYFARQV